MKVWHRRNVRVLIAVALAVLFLAPAALASAATSDRSITGRTASYTYCTTAGACSPLFYAWDAFTHITYDWTDLYHYTLHFEDQSIIMHNARNNPCGITIGISTDTSRDGSYFGTVYVQQAGSYVYPYQDINWGGYAWPEWSIDGMTANAAASGYNCLGGGSDSFYVGP